MWKAGGKKGREGTGKEGKGREGVEKGEQVDTESQRRKARRKEEKKGGWQKRDLVLPSFPTLSLAFPFLLLFLLPPLFYYFFFQGRT